MSYMRDKAGRRLDDIAVTPAVTWLDLPTTGLVSIHRGSGTIRQNAPQSSYEGFDQALALGAHVMDSDGQFSAERVRLVMHDANLLLTTGVDALTTDIQLQHLPPISQPQIVGNGWAPTDIPTLEGMIGRYQGRACITHEPKSGEVPELIALIQRYHAEKFVMIGYYAGAADAATVFAQINAAGIGIHTYGVSTTAICDMIQAAGGVTIAELPISSDPTFIAYAKSHGCYRVICSPIGTRAEEAAVPATLNGYVSDSPGYVGRKSGDLRQSSNIARAIETGKAGNGWFLWTKVLKDWLIPGDGLYVQTAVGNQGVCFGDLSGIIATNTKVTVPVRFGTAGNPATLPTDLARAVRMRVLATTESGIGQDANTNGYIHELRANGQIRLYTSNATLGLGASVIGKIPVGEPCIAGKVYPITTEVDATRVRGYRDDVTVTLNGAVTAGTRTSLTVLPTVDPLLAGAKFNLPDGTQVTTSAAVPRKSTALPITSAAVPAMASGLVLTRDDGQATISTAVAAGTVTSLPVKPLVLAVASGDKFVLPDGTEVTASAAAAIGVSAIPITSAAVPAMTPGQTVRQSSGWVANTDWRGPYHTINSSMSVATGGLGAITDFRVSP